MVSSIGWRSTAAAFLRHTSTGTCITLTKRGYFFSYCQQKLSRRRWINAWGKKQQESHHGVGVRKHGRLREAAPIGHRQGYETAGLCQGSVNAVAYTHNTKAWMTGDNFCKWLTDFDKEMSVKKCKVLLLLDNCSAHHVNTHLSTVEVLFLPPNTTAKLQPVDQGVIANIKQRYRRRVMSVCSSTPEQLRTQLT